VYYSSSSSSSSSSSKRFVRVIGVFPVHHESPNISTLQFNINRFVWFAKRRRPEAHIEKFSAANNFANHMEGKIIVVLKNYALLTVFINICVCMFAS